MMQARVLEDADLTEQSGREKGRGGRPSKGTAGVKTLREENEVAASTPNCPGVGNPTT